MNSLSDAIAHGEKDLTSFILKDCLKIKNEEGLTPIEQAMTIEKISCEAIKNLMYEGCLDDNKLLIFALENKCKDEIINMFIVKDNIKIKDKYGRIPFEHAIKQGASYDIKKSLMFEGCAKLLKEKYYDEIIKPLTPKDELKYALENKACYDTIKNLMFEGCLDDNELLTIALKEECSEEITNLFIKDNKEISVIKTAIKWDSSPNVIKNLLFEGCLDDNELLLSAIYWQCDYKVINMLATKDNIKIKDSKGDLPISKAISKNLGYKVIKNLIFEGCLDEVDQYNCTHLTHAIYNSASYDVIKLLRTEKNILVKDPDGMLPIHLALKDMRYDILDLLNDEKALREVYNGNTPIHKYLSNFSRTDTYSYIHVYNPNINIIKLLNHKKALRIKNSDGYTPVHYALKHNFSYEIIELLNDPKALLMFDNKGNLPVHYGINNKISPDILKLVVTRKVLETKNKDGYLPLHLSLCNKLRYEYTRILTIKSILTVTDNSKGRTPLIWLLCSGREDIRSVKLLTTDEVLEIRCKENNLPIHYGLVNSKPYEIIKLLFNKKIALLKDVVLGKFTILQYIIEENLLKYSNLLQLLNYEEVLSIKNENGETPLSYVLKNIKKFDYLYVKYLISEAALTSKDAEGDTPLLYVLKNYSHHFKHIGLNYFISKEALLVKDSSGFYPLEVAKNKGLSFTISSFLE